MSHNHITELPPSSMWSSLEINELNFSHNMIEKFDLFGAKNNLQSLEYLDVSYNLLKRVSDLLL